MYLYNQYKGNEQAGIEKISLTKGSAYLMFYYKNMCSL